MPNHNIALTYETPIQPSLAADDDASLVRRIRAGDASAEHFLTTKFQPRIKRLGRQLGADETLCEDLAQEAILKVIVNLRGNRLNEVAKLSAYIDQTARFTYYAWQRNKNNQLEFRHSCDDTQHTCNVEQECMQASNRRWVLKQIEKLNTWRDRQLLLQFCMNHQEKHDVCVALELSHDQFDKALYRARQRLQKVVHG